jgi:C-lobe and N-lobe beta barrels of Tf-binding protein B
MYCRSTLVLVVGGGIWLTACGGGGGSSPVMPASSSVPFTSFSAVKSGQPVQASGISQTVNATTTTTGTVTSTTVNAVDTANSSATLTYGVIPAMTAFSFSTPGSGVNLSGSSVQCNAGTGVCGGSSGNTQAVVINPLDPQVPPVPELAWNYQSFGYWLVVGSSTSRVAGVMSFGSPTAVSALPVMGTASYTGLSSGIYVDPTGAVFVQGAKMQSTVDFGPARSVAFSTTDTTLAPLNPAIPVTPVSVPALNLTGNLSIASGSNQFSGSVTAPGTPALAGTATGRFYGPTAQEIGGVFSLKGTGPQTMLGGFGGKQP